MLALVCSAVKTTVNFLGTCDLPLFLSQTTAVVNKEAERKMQRGIYSGAHSYFCLEETHAECCQHVTTLYGLGKLIEELAIEQLIQSLYCFKKDSFFYEKATSKTRLKRKIAIQSSTHLPL